MAEVEDQQFCLRWNNFQANITSQFEVLRDDEDFTDVTIACEGQRLQAHKVVLSACSPYFKEIFKNNPCQHPIIFMRDVEARHIAALMEFMYAGQVNVAQAHLSGFLKTAESLKIRGLTDTTSLSEDAKEQEDKLNLSSKSHTSGAHKQKIQISSTSTVTSSQDIKVNSQSKVCNPPPAKRQCKADRTESDIHKLGQLNVIKEDSTLGGNLLETHGEIRPKVELPDYASDDEREEGNYFNNAELPDLASGMDIIPHAPSSGTKGLNQDLIGEINHINVPDQWLPFEDSLDNQLEETGIISRIREYGEKPETRKNRLIKLAEGIEIYEEQLRSVKWNDYRKLTRGLATILFSPAELASCSVTGQRWSRAGNGERPVKPALDRAKVQAIISYVTTRFPMVETSRIKQVLAYKCKENSTAFKMKAVRFFGDHLQNGSKN